MKWSLAILLLSTPAAAAGLVDEREPQEFPCSLQLLPDRQLCPVEYQRRLKAIMKRRPPTKIDHLEDRIERLEREIEGLRK